MNKICTDINQSKKLIELGIDVTTADMYYSYDSFINEYEDDAQIIPQSELGQHFSLFPEDIPAWSLSALLSVLPQSVRLVGNPKDTYWYCECVNSNNQWYAGFGSADNPVDACYEMIIKLHKLYD